MAADTTLLTVLFDDECGFCTCSARLIRRLDRSRRIRLLPVTAAADIPGAPSEDRLRELIHAVDRNGRWSAGGAASLAIADLVPVLKPIAWLGRLPLVRELVEPAYALVAANRHLLSRLLGLDACALKTDRRRALAPSRRGRPRRQTRP